MASTPVRAAGCRPDWKHVGDQSQHRTAFTTVSTRTHQMVGPSKRSRVRKQRCFPARAGRSASSLLLARSSLAVAQVIYALVLLSSTAARLLGTAGPSRSPYKLLGSPGSASRLSGN